MLSSVRNNKMVPSPKISSTASELYQSDFDEPEEEATKPPDVPSVGGKTNNEIKSMENKSRDPIPAYVPSFGIVKTGSFSRTRGRPNATKAIEPSPAPAPIAPSTSASSTQPTTIDSSPAAIPTTSATTPKSLDPSPSSSKQQHNADVSRRGYVPSFGGESSRQAIGRTQDKKTKKKEKEENINRSSSGNNIERRISDPVPSPVSAPEQPRQQQKDPSYVNNLFKPKKASSTSYSYTQKSNEDKKASSSNHSQNNADVGKSSTSQNNEKNSGGRSTTHSAVMPAAVNIAQATTFSSTNKSKAIKATSAEEEKGRAELNVLKERNVELKAKVLEYKKALQASLLTSGSSSTKGNDGLGTIARLGFNRFNDITILDKLLEAATRQILSYRKRNHELRSNVAKLNDQSLLRRLEKKADEKEARIVELKNEQKALNHLLRGFEKQVQIDRKAKEDLPKVIHSLQTDVRVYQFKLQRLNHFIENVSQQEKEHAQQIHALRDMNRDLLSRAKLDPELVDEEVMHEPTKLLLRRKKWVKRESEVEMEKVRLRQEFVTSKEDLKLSKKEAEQELKALKMEVQAAEEERKRLAGMVQLKEKETRLQALEVRITKRRIRGIAVAKQMAHKSRSVSTKLVPRIRSRQGSLRTVHVPLAGSKASNDRLIPPATSSSALRDNHSSIAAEEEEEEEDLTRFVECEINREAQEEEEEREEILLPTESGKTPSFSVEPPGRRKGGMTDGGGLDLPGALLIPSAENVTREEDDLEAAYMMDDFD